MNQTQTPKPLVGRVRACVSHIITHVCGHVRRTHGSASHPSPLPEQVDVAIRKSVFRQRAESKRRHNGTHLQEERHDTEYENEFPWIELHSQQRRGRPWAM